MSGLLVRTLLIHPEERRSTAYFFFVFLLIGCGMALGKGSADALFFKRFGIEFLPAVFLVQSVLLFIVTTAYATYADRWAPERLLIPLALMLVAILFALWLMMTWFSLQIAYPFYLLVYDISSDIFFVHCTLYIAKNYDVLQAKRLTPLILGGWQVGAVFGGIIIAIATHWVGVENIPIIWIVLLFISVILVRRYHKNSGMSPYHRTGRRGRDPVRQAIEQISQTAAFLKKSPLLRAMSFALFFMVITYYVLCYSVNLLYTQTFQSESGLAIFYGILGASTGSIALLIQMFATNRLIRRYGVRAMNMVFPSLTVFGFSLLLASFILPFAIFSSVIKDAVMPALRNPVRALFFNALPSFIQGRSHALSVGIVLPLALATAGLFLVFAQQTGSPEYFLAIGLGASIIYTVCSWRMNKSYVNSIIESLKQKLYVPNEDLAAALTGDESEVFKVLERAGRHEEAEIRFSAAKTLMELFPEKAGPVVLNILPELSSPLQDQLLFMLAPLEPPEFRQRLWDEIEHEDSHLRATVLSILFQFRDSDAKALVQQALSDNNPRIRIVGIYGVMHYPIKPLQENALTAWRAMLTSNNSGEILAGLELLSQMPKLEFSTLLPPLLQSPEPRIRASAMQVFESWPNNDIDGLYEILTAQLASDDFNTRIIGTKRVAMLDDNERRKLATRMIEDVHPAVRTSAAQALFPHTAQLDELANWLAEHNVSPRSQQAVLHVLMERNPPRHMMEKIAYHMALDAKSLIQVRSALVTFGKGFADQQNERWRLLDIVLLERCLQVLDLSLLAASIYENPGTIGVLRAGINSQDRRHWASTCEAVRYIEDKNLARQLVLILEYLNGEPVQKSNSISQFTDIKSIYMWATSRGDEWLLECVTHTLQDFVVNENPT